MGAVKTLPRNPLGNTGPRAAAGSLQVLKRQRFPFLSVRAWCLENQDLLKRRVEGTAKTQSLG